MPFTVPCVPLTKKPTLISSPPRGGEGRVRGKDGREFMAVCTKHVSL
jgi:hypothetical protein